MKDYDIREYELQLISGWIRGDNREHIREFDCFTYFPELFEAISKMKPEEIDILSVSRKAKIKVADIAKLIEDYFPPMYDACYRSMKEQKVKAMLEEAAKHPTNIAAQLEAISKEMDKLQVSKIKEPTDLCEAYKKEIQKRKTTEPLKFGLPTLDYITGGLRSQELTVLAARPSIGKTALALQVAFNLALKKNKVLFFPLEMAPAQLMERIACRETSIKHEKLKTPKQMDEKDDEMLRNFFEIYGPVMNPYLHIIDKVKHLSEIGRYIEHYRPSVVFIDQLSQLREKRKFGSLREQFTYMTNTLKEYTKDYDMPIVLLAQINRDGQNREPLISDIKESGSIEEDADNIILLHQTDEKIGDCTPISLIVGKQRNGEREVRIPCMYQNKKFIFREVAK